VDRYGDYAVVSCETDEASQRAPELASILGEHGARAVYLKVRARADLRRVPQSELAPDIPLVGTGAPERIEVREGAVRLYAHLADGLSTGVFPDQRESRRRVFSLADGARMLNLFSYTGAFTIAAALGGARETVSVDVSRRALSRLSDNLDLNGLTSEAHHLVKEDAARFLSRARRRGERFDLVVLDPPSFATAGARTFSVPKHYRALATDAIAILAPRGSLIAVTNHRKTSRERFRGLLWQAAEAARRSGVRLVDLPVPLDFPDRVGGAAPVKSVLLTVE
jgi:23S rRNA (cytosine1962-C5)-methyltransferase